MHYGSSCFSPILTSTMKDSVTASYFYELLGFWIHALPMASLFCCHWARKCPQSHPNPSRISLSKHAQALSFGQFFHTFSGVCLPPTDFTCPLASRSKNLKIKCGLSCITCTHKFCMFKPHLHTTHARMLWCIRLYTQCPLLWTTISLLGW